MIKINYSRSFGDDYYWDDRVSFEYDGKNFDYIMVGSFSGYIPRHEEISYSKNIDEALHCNEGSDFDVCEENLAYYEKLAKRLIESGKEFISIDEE